MKPQHETHINVNCDNGEVSITGVYTHEGEIVSEWTENGWEDVNEEVIKQNTASNLGELIK